MHCANCGNKLEEHSSYCSSCGAKKGSEAVALAPQFGKSWSIENLWHGRIARWHYFVGSMLPVLGIFILVSVWGVIRLLQSTFTISGSAATTVDAFSLVNTFASALIGLLITVFIIAFFLVHIPLAIRRCHDLGYTGWLSLLAYVPYVGFIAALYFIFAKGESGVNQYGNPTVERKF